MLTACIPAATPAHLDATPGPAVVVTDRLYDAGLFTVRYPHTWRIVTAPAEAPYSVIFVAPDETALIMAALDSIETLPSPSVTSDGPLRTEQRTISLSSELTVAIAGIAPAANWDSFGAVFERVVNSLRPG